MADIKGKINEIGAAVCKEDIGFLPTSNSTKPVHIANGLFRRCRGEECDISAVHEWVTSERRKSDTIISSEAIREKYADILIAGKNEEIDNIANVRFVLEEIFNQDKASFPTLENSVLNISSHWLIKKKVDSEALIDKFIFDILTQDIKGKQSAAIDLINDSLKDDSDDLTMLIKPIILHSDKISQSGISDRKEIDIDKIPLDASKVTIRNAFDNLARNMKAFGQNKNSLLVLQRMVNLASFSAVYYLMTVNCTKYSENTIPLLLDAGIGLNSIEHASEECLIAGKKSVEDFFVNSIRARLLQEIEKPDSNEVCLDYIAKMIITKANKSKKKFDPEEVRESLISFYSSFHADGNDPVQALARAIQLIIYTYVYPNNTPSDFCRALGARVGLVGPRGNAIKKKRLLANRFLLETLTLSALTEDELRFGIELRELGDKLREMYGIVLGVDVEKDYELLEKCNISQNTPGDLRGDLTINARAIAEMYISIRMAKKYADGVTIIEMEV
jgi:hypothetical protein